MAFTSIVSGTDTYVPREEGVYALSTKTFSAPAQEIRLRGATRNRDGSLSGSASFLLEKDVTVNGASVRKAMRIVVMPQITTDFTIDEFQIGMKALADFYSDDSNVNRFLSGES